MCLRSHQFGSWLWLECSVWSCFSFVLIVYEFESSIHASLTSVIASRIRHLSRLRVVKEKRPFGWVPGWLVFSGFKYIYIYSLIQLAYYIRHTTGDPGGCPNWPNGTDGTGESKVSSVRTVTVGGIWMWGCYDLEMNMLNVLKPASYHQTSSVQTNIKHHKTIQPIQIYPWN